MLAQCSKKPASNLAGFFELPSPMAERTLIWDIFDYIFEADRQRRGRINPIRTYRNPIFLAREWAEAMEARKFRSQRAFARAIGLSHARVSQVLGLLRLCSGTQEDLEALGDPLYSRMITERKLRSLVNLPRAEQRKRIRGLLRKYAQLSPRLPGLSRKQTLTGAGTGG